MRHLKMIMLLAIIISSCSPCRKVATEDKYLVWVQEGIMKNYDCKEKATEADAYIYKVAGLPLTVDSLIGKRRPYLYLDNGDVEVYVEKENFRKRKLGKKRK